MVGLCRALCPAAIRKFADARAAPAYRDARSPDTSGRSPKWRGDRCTKRFLWNGGESLSDFAKHILRRLGGLNDESTGHRLGDGDSEAVRSDRHS